MSSPEMRVATKTAPKATPAKVVATIPDYVAVTAKQDDALRSRIRANPIYKIIIDSGLPFEQGVTKAVEYLTEGLADDTIKSETLDARRTALTEFNVYIQMVRRELGT